MFTTLTTLWGLKRSPFKYKEHKYVNSWISVWSEERFHTFAGLDMFELALVKRGISNGLITRLIYRSLYVCFTTFVAVSLPFLWASFPFALLLVPACNDLTYYVQSFDSQVDLKISTLAIGPPSFLAQICVCPNGKLAKLDVFWAIRAFRSLFKLDFLPFRGPKAIIYGLAKFYPRAKWSTFVCHKKCTVFVVALHCGRRHIIMEPSAEPQLLTSLSNLLMKKARVSAYQSLLFKS